MKKILLSLALCASFLIIKTNAAKAQVVPDSVETSNIAVTIATVTELTADNGNLETFAFTNGTELQSGITQSNAVTLSYKSNKVTTVTIKALSGFFTGGNADMPVSVISYKKNSGSTYANLSTTATALSTSQGKGAGSFGIDYKITPGLTYDPATDYAVTIEYTLTPQ